MCDHIATMLFAVHPFVFAGAIRCNSCKLLKLFQVIIPLQLSRFTILPLFMIIAYSTGRPIIIPHSTVGARHFSFSHKLESNCNIDSAIHYESYVVNNILCCRRSPNKRSVCIDVCFS